MLDSDFYGNNIQDRILGLLLARTQAIACRTGKWTFKDQEGLKQAFMELESLRIAASRYSQRVQEYRQAVEDALHFIADQNKIDLDKFMESWYTRSDRQGGSK